MNDKYFNSGLLYYVNKSIKPYGKLLFLTHTGSHLYGTETENSDDDYVGVYIMPLEKRISLNPNRKTIDLSITDKDETGKNTKNAIDITIYELEHFLKLLVKSNPNIIELLFTDTSPDAIIYLDDIFKPIFKKKLMFLSKRIKSTFYGYAYSQYNKINKDKPNYKQLSTIIRILESGLDILNMSNFRFPLHKCLQYRDIKEGKYDFDKLIEYIQDLLGVFRNVNVYLPEKPNIDEINKLYYSMVMEAKNE